MEILKSTEDSLTEHVQLLMPRHINGAGRLFGGQLMEWIDVVAGVVARRHAGCNVITAAVDNLQFKAGAHLDETVVLRGKITYVGNTSMEVRVDTYVEDFAGMRRPINRAYLVMVALDENDKPVRVPRLEIKTEAEKAEWEGAIKRNEFRKTRRAEGF
ncbi:acyl-CoA hydrolase [Lachnospiraceae bacterium KM106-2]|nr:acyl-CoA hydrolase [Lachnospiraceae bacterium KM106-2]